ncbi:FUSC family protein [Streptomyces sp. NPDC002537]
MISIPWDRTARSAIVMTAGVVGAVTLAGPACSSLVIIGALCSVNADFSGELGGRVRRLAGAIAGGAAGIVIGKAAPTAGWHQVAMLALAGLVAGLLGGWGPGRALAGLKLMVLTAIGTGVGAEVPTGRAIAFYLLGTAPMVAMLLGAWLTGEPGRAALGPPPAEVPTRPRPLTCPRRWGGGLRMAFCLGLAAAIAVLLHPQHASWLLMTTALVFRIDDESVFDRVAHRTAGTIAGVLTAALLVQFPHGWITLVIAGAVGAVLPGFTDRAYALHVALVSVVVLILAQPTTPAAPDAFVARLVDTLIACGLALAVGYLVWPDRSRSLTTTLPTPDASRRRPAS